MLLGFCRFFLSLAGTEMPSPIQILYIKELGLVAVRLSVPCPSYEAFHRRRSTGVRIQKTCHRSNYGCQDSKVVSSMSCRDSPSSKVRILMTSCRRRTSGVGFRRRVTEYVQRASGFKSPDFEDVLSTSINRCQDSKDMSPTSHIRCPNGFRRRAIEVVQRAPEFKSPDSEDVYRRRSTGVRIQKTYHRCCARSVRIQKTFHQCRTRASGFGRYVTDVEQRASAFRIRATVVVQQVSLFII